MNTSSGSKRVTIIIVTIVLLVGAAAIIWWTRLMSGNSPQSTNNQSSAELLGDTYTSPEHSVSLKFPKGWGQAPITRNDPYAVVKYQNPQFDTEDSIKGHAAADLTVQLADEDLESYTRRIIEANLNASVQAKQLENKDIAINGQPARLLSYEIPNQAGIKGRIDHYIFIKNNKYYDLSFSALASKWSQYQAAFDASVHSLSWM